MIKTLVAIAAGILVVLLQVKIGDGFGDTLDAGWGEVLNWGISHGAQWGKELVFTYGPLGFLTPDIPFDPATYWPTLILQHLFAVATACLVVVNLRRLPLISGLSFLIATIVMGWNWSSSAALIIVYPLAILPLERVTRRDTPASLSTHIVVAALAAYAALLPLIKFSVFPLWIAWLPLGTFILWRSRARPLVVTFLSASLLAPTVAWLACGQHLANLPAFVATSWQEAVQYGAAMQANPAEHLVDQVALGAAFFGMVCAVGLAWLERPSMRRVAVCIMFAITIALAYRAGATRPDGGHLGILWSVVAWCTTLLAGLMYARLPAPRPRQAAMAFVLALLALTPEWLSGLYPPFTLQQVYWGQYAAAYVKLRVNQLLSPRQTYQRKIAQWSADRKKLAVPKIARTIRHDPVDVLMDAQSVLLANDFNYTPRPVFQSYSAYSGKLARLNAAFFEGEHAPAWVMLRWSTIDDHYPTSDDPLALVRILQTYRPVLSDGTFLLFRRTAANAADTAVASGEPYAVDLKFGTFNAIPPAPSGTWFAKVDVRLTFFGKLRSLIYREPKLRIEVKTKDGTTRLYSLVRAIARSGFMLSPAIADNSQYLDWIDGGDEREVTAVRLVQHHFQGKPEFKLAGPLRLYPVKLPREGARTLALYAARYPGFNQLPASVSAHTRIFTVGTHSVMFLPAPATLTFHLSPGIYGVSAKFGLVPNALTDPGCLKAHPDGVGIQLGIQGKPADPSAVAFLDPYKDSRHRYAGDFSHRLKVDAGQTVTVSLTSGPPGSNGACDWSWIRDLQFNREGATH